MGTYLNLRRPVSGSKPVVGKKPLIPFTKENVKVELNNGMMAIPEVRYTIVLDRGDEANGIYDDIVKFTLEGGAKKKPSIKKTVYYGYMPKRMAMEHSAAECSSKGPIMILDVPYNENINLIKDAVWRATSERDMTKNVLISNILNVSFKPSVGFSRTDKDVVMNGGFVFTDTVTKNGPRSERNYFLPLFMDNERMGVEEVYEDIDNETKNALSPIYLNDKINDKGRENFLKLGMPMKSRFVVGGYVIDKLVSGDKPAGGVFEAVTISFVYSRNESGRYACVGYHLTGHNRTLEEKSFTFRNKNFYTDLIRQNLPRWAFETYDECQVFREAVDTLYSSWISQFGFEEDCESESVDETTDSEEVISDIANDVDETVDETTDSEEVASDTDEVDGDLLDDVDETVDCVGEGDVDVLQKGEGEEESQ